jgi:hypothetical protein
MKKDLIRMCYEHLRCKFDLRYEIKCKLDPLYQKWLEQEPKEKYVLCYDDDHWYGNMTTNLLKSFDHVLKGVYAMPVSTLV